MHRMPVAHGLRAGRLVENARSTGMAAFDPDDSFIDLYWIPVGAGTHLQALSLSLYEILAASVARRPRATLYHGALKLRLRGRSQTLELMPVPRHQANPPLMTGPVGVRGADRLRRFRYQLYCADSDLFPDEKWAVGSPKRLTTDPATVERLLANAPGLPSHTWGRRAHGTTEMWTSDSATSWLLAQSGIDLSQIELPKDGRAPGWKAGAIAAAGSPFGVT